MSAQIDPLSISFLATSAHFSLQPDTQIYCSPNFKATPLVKVVHPQALTQESPEFLIMHFDLQEVSQVVADNTEVREMLSSKDRVMYLFIFY